MHSFSCCLNPYFIGLPILITFYAELPFYSKESLNPYFIGLPILIFLKNLEKSLQNHKVSILILLDYLFLYHLEL